MTRLEKCELLKSKGYTYDLKTGKIYGMKGKEIIRKDQYGYIILTNNLKGHHFGWYMTYNNVDFIELDHIDVNPSNNKIDNLRILTRSQQLQNRIKVKGYYLHKSSGLWNSRIVSNSKVISLGYFKTEEEARNAYLEAKKIHHII